MRTPSGALWRFLLMFAVVIVCFYVVVQAISRPAGGKTTGYVAEFNDVFGLRTNADVRIRGVQVGKVTDIDVTRDGTARVRFTVKNDQAMTRDDRLAIRFQNLTGQRYLAIETGAPGAPKLPAGEKVANDHTTGSFDITTLFNGLRPILKGADPAVFNEFGENLIALLQGEGGVGIGDVMADIDKLSSYAVSKQDLLVAIAEQLGVISKQIGGNSAFVTTVLNSMRDLSYTFDTNIDQMVRAFYTGAEVFPRVAELLMSGLDLGLGGHDNVEYRVMEITRDLPKLTEAMNSLPGITEPISKMAGYLDAPMTCSKGEAQLPDLSNVLLAGGRVTVCNR